MNRSHSSNSNFSSNPSQLNFGAPIGGTWHDGSGTLNFGNTVGGGWKDENNNFQFGTPGQGSNYIWTSKPI